ncbi:MAG: Vesicle trafficking between the ER and Golgi [Cirrosporium novae-zelandiae]|nr:MAG: Vesicle trafficking between the ER and Golgi [Cirrosporium novae-zelandiae]
MASQYQSLRDRQITMIEKILNLNQEPPRTSEDHHEPAASTGIIPSSTPILNADGDPIWKVLVFDNLGRDVISSVLRVNDLRSWGVTIHLHINSQRHPIPDVPVLYLLEPTPENLQHINEDLSQNLYSPAYINFLSSVPRLLLEEFAAQIAASGTSESIAQVYDQYLNFIVGEPDLFSLGMGSEVYTTMNSPQTSDGDIDKVIDRIVSSLFGVAVTMGAIPIIRCPKGGAGQLISEKLDRKLRDHILNSKDNLFSSANQRSNAAGIPSSRPVLIIVDRNVDLVPMLSHSWTYQSLVNDVLQMRLNKITVQPPTTPDSTPSKEKPKSYDLTANDFFWARNANVPFPQVAEDIDAELTRYKEDANDITRRTGASSLDDLQNDTNAPTAHLKEAITMLPELRERKATLDMHMNILAALLTGIKDRQLDNFYQLEESISKQAKVQILEFINDASKGINPIDKLRLFIIWYLTMESDLTRAELTQFTDALTAAGVTDTSPITYVKGLREITRMTMLSTTEVAPSQQPNLLRGFSSLSSRLTSHIKDTTNLNLPNLDSLIAGVKNFLPANKDLTLTQITQSLMDPATASSDSIAKTENYLYFDPRSSGARGIMPGSSANRTRIDNGQQPGVTASFGMRRQGFSEGIVFVVGGGSVDEYGNLQDWVQRTGGDDRGGNVRGGGGSAVGGGRGGGASPRRHVVYGSTEIVNAETFLKELSTLGNESG